MLSIQTDVGMNLPLSGSVTLGNLASLRPVPHLQIGNEALYVTGHLIITGGNKHGAPSREQMPPTC